MLAELIEVVGIDSGFKGAFQTFAQFNVEYVETQSARGFAISGALSQPQPVAANLRVNTGLCGRRWYRCEGKRMGESHRRGGRG
jgi:non-canonical (house-cleaning) NTP pyrophosphatase